MGTNRKLKKMKPVQVNSAREFEQRMESLQGAEDDTAIVSLDLRKLIPAYQPGSGSEHQRAVVKAAEQIHSRMLVMGLEKTEWHDLGIDAYDSYCIAAYTALNAALQCAITFVPVGEDS